MKAIFSCLFIILAGVAANSQSKSFEDILKARNFDLKQFCNTESDLVNRKVLEEYGAYVAAKDIVFPTTCVFSNQSEIDLFLKRLKGKTKMITIANETFEFQTAAANSLMNEVFPALLKLKPKNVKPYELPRQSSNGIVLRIDGKKVAEINTDWAGRDYKNTLTNWRTRDTTNPRLNLANLSDKVKKERIDSIIEEELSSNNQQKAKPKYFYKSQNKPIMRSAAIPGASQHILLIAFDLNTNTCLVPGVIGILNSAGWYQTVPNDDCHFTYLGWTTTEQMKNNGLKKVKCKINGTAPNNHRFWIPNIRSFDFSVYKKWECSETN